MKPDYDRSSVNMIMEIWRRGHGVFSLLCGHPAFRLKHRYKQDFMQKQIAPGRCLHDPLHIDCIDMSRHHSEIVRNLKHVCEADPAAGCCEVSRYLSEEARDHTDGAVYRNSRPVGGELHFSGSIAPVVS